MTGDNHLMHTILILDDEPSVLSAMKRVIARIPPDWLQAPCQINTFSDPLQALKSLDGVSYDLIISDLRMPGTDGLTFLRLAMKFQPQAVRIAISGDGDVPAIMSVLNESRVFRFIEKPWNDTELQTVITQALHTCVLQRENQRLADEVRTQRGTITKQEAMLRELESECPGITRIERDERGAIYLDEEDI